MPLTVIHTYVTLYVKYVTNAMLDVPVRVKGAINVSAMLIYGVGEICRTAFIITLSICFLSPSLSS